MWMSSGNSAPKAVVDGLKSLRLDLILTHFTTQTPTKQAASVPSQHCRGKADHLPSLMQKVLTSWRMTLPVLTRHSFDLQPMKQR